MLVQINKVYLCDVCDKTIKIETWQQTRILTQNELGKSLRTNHTIDISVTDETFNDYIAYDKKLSIYNSLKMILW